MIIDAVRYEVWLVRHGFNGGSRRLLAVSRSPTHTEDLIACFSTSRTKALFHTTNKLYFVYHLHINSTWYTTVINPHCKLGCQSDISRAHALHLKLQVRHILKLTAYSRIQQLLVLSCTCS